jgi:hypothetical protein
VVECGHEHENRRRQHARGRCRRDDPRDTPGRKKQIRKGYLEQAAEQIRANGQGRLGSILRIFSLGGLAASRLLETVKGLGRDRHPHRRRASTRLLKVELVLSEVRDTGLPLEQAIFQRRTQRQRMTFAIDH